MESNKELSKQQINFFLYILTTAFEKINKNEANYYELKAKQKIKYKNRSKLYY